MVQQVLCSSHKSAKQFGQSFAFDSPSASVHGLAKMVSGPTGQ